MAVRVLPGSVVRAPHRVANVPPLALALTLTAPALDLFFRVQPTAAVSAAAGFFSGAVLAVLVFLWLRHPRTSWLLAGALAATASLALRLAHADGAPLLSLLAVVALGVGGAFASYEPELTIEGA